MKSIYCFAAWAIIVCCWMASPALSQTASSDALKWVSFPDCPVLLENVTIVPARDSGIVQTVAVEVNEPVTKGQLLLSLENDDAVTKLQAAKENHALAVHLAADDYDLKLRKLALEQAEVELASHSEISKSVSATELRRLQFNVASARVAVTNAEYTLKGLRMKADSAANAVEAAKKTLANREVHSPSSGIIRELMVRPGNGSTLASRLWRSGTCASYKSTASSPSKRST